MQRTPVLQYFGFPIYGHQNIVALVSRLFMWRSPPAVFGAVPRIVVNPVKREPLSKGRGHVRVKCGDVMPAITHRNPSATIVGEFFVRRIFTAFQHMKPSCVNRITPKPMLCAVVSILAAATFGCADLDRSKLSASDRAAIASIDGFVFVDAWARVLADLKDNDPAEPIPWLHCGARMRGQTEVVDIHCAALLVSMT